MNVHGVPNLQLLYSLTYTIVPGIEACLIYTKYDLVDVFGVFHPVL